jgi:hypothetical protein
MFSSSMAICLLICAVSSNKGHRSTNEHVDLIELNHFYDQQGRLVYDQVIFYEQAPETGRFQVRAWCLVEDREWLSRRPTKNYDSQLYQVDWYDSDQRLLRKITSRLYRESWSQVDPERANKKLLDERMRLAMVQNPSKLLSNESGTVLDDAKITNSPSSSLAVESQNSQTPTPPSVVPIPPRSDSLVAK